MSLLSTQKLSRSFGGLKAVDNVDFELESGQIHALIGPNGAGKTTFVSLLCGRLRPDSGKIRFGGQEITRLPAHERVALGIAYTFQITSIYANLSVFDNVALAAASAARRPNGNRDVRAATHDALERTGLRSRASETAGTLSYGHRRLVEIAMGLALKPKLLILDEPTQGLANSEISDFKNLAAGLKQTTTLLLIEHNMDVVMDLADSVTVLNFGQVLATGPRETIRSNPAVQSAYLGT